MRENGFYWVLLKADGPYPEEWTIGQYDGSSSSYPWEIIASDEIFRDEDFVKIGPKIAPKEVK